MRFLVGIITRCTEANSYEESNFNQVCEVMLFLFFGTVFRFRLFHSYCVGAVTTPTLKLALGTEIITSKNVLDRLAEKKKELEKIKEKAKDQESAK